MFLIEFNLGFQEVSENLQQKGTAEMKKRASISHNSVRKGVAVFQSSFSFSIRNKLPARAKVQLVNMFHFTGCFIV